MKTEEERRQANRERRGRALAKMTPEEARAKNRERVKAWRQANPDRAKEHTKRWWKVNGKAYYRRKAYDRKTWSELNTEVASLRACLKDLAGMLMEMNVSPLTFRKGVVGFEIATGKRPCPNPDLRTRPDVVWDEECERLFNESKFT